LRVDTLIQSVGAVTLVLIEVTTSLSLIHLAYRIVSEVIVVLKSKDFVNVELEYHQPKL
jgi:hypothetical protein